MSDGTPNDLPSAIEKLCLILGALYAHNLGDLDQNEKAERLSRCGFSNGDIAGLLGTTANAINVALHRARKRAKGKRGKRS